MLECLEQFSRPECCQLLTQPPFPSILYFSMSPEIAGQLCIICVKEPPNKPALTMAASSSPLKHMSHTTINILNHWYWLEENINRSISILDQFTDLSYPISHSPSSSSMSSQYDFIFSFMPTFFFLDYFTLSHVTLFGHGSHV